MDCYSNDTDTHDIEQLISEVEAHLDKTFLVIQKRNMEDSKKENSTNHIEKTTLKSDGKLDAKLSVKEYAHEKVSASNLKIDEIDNEMGDYVPIAQENILECTEYEIYSIQEHVADNQLKEHFELEELNKEYSKINIEIHNMQQTKSNMMNNVVCMKDKNMLNAKNKNKSYLVDAIVIENREDPSNLESSVDFILMKKKKKKKVKFAPEIVTSAMHDTAIINCPQVNKPNFDQYFDDTTADYTYDYLLTRAFKMIREKNPNLNEEGKKKLIMKPPQVLRIGAKKTSFANFLEICRILHRLPHHLQSFLLTELGTSGSVDGNNQLIIKGRFQQKQIESVLRKYIKEYVTCHTCYSPSTLLQRNTRLCFLQCEACGSRCSVASIKSGFQAVINKRAAMRAKAL